jgi:serine/threonine protein kinase
MAEVWKAFDRQLQRYVALKILHADLQNDPSFITRFEREAQVIASLHHPSIVQIHDFHISRPPESDSTIAYMVMDYVEGSTLADYIRNTSRKGMFPPAADIVHLFTPIGAAIDYAHHKGMVHRDIKPANILLDKRTTVSKPMGSPILTDFGIVKLLGATTGTLSGSWLGTPLYVSPEQAQGYPGNERSDIYSLGIVLYEVCTGVQPFRGENINAIIMQHINATPTPPALINPNIPPALTLVILRCLAKDPAARFSTASLMATAIAEALNVPLPADPNSAPYSVEAMSGPTHYVVLQSNPPQSEIPLATALPGIGSTPVPQSVVPFTPLPTPPPSSGLATSMASPGATPASTSGAGRQPVERQASPYATPVLNQLPLTASQVPPGATPSSLSPSSPVSGAGAGQTRRRWKGIFIALSVLLILVPLIGGLSTWFLLSQKPSSPSASAGSQIVGHLRFISSGRLYVNNNHGINDEVQISLQNIHDPAPGKAYYGWLLGDTDASLTEPLLLGNGKLPVSNGTVTYLYPGDSQQSNLLTTYSRFLMTEEDAQTTPSVPSFDLSAWRYVARIPATPDPKDTKFHFSMLDHLRHLLSDEKSISSIGLHGGLGIWLLRNTEEVFKWSVAAKDRWESHNPASTRQNIINILYYLDGYACIEPDLQNVPPGSITTPENETISRIARVALIEPCSQHGLGYLRHIGVHLIGLTAAPGATQETRDAATQIDKAINNVMAWLEQLRLDAVQLANMTDTQLTQQKALDILGDLATQARNAYAGQVDPRTGEWLGGVTWIYSSMQRVVAFDITPCTRTTSACV